ncbi:unnamed protein product [Thlaspi arvense]|uniref:Uncharacterized protein n=1 Tax=Thlaspi arvense TaxID=13288 RepID=A0AAU9RSV9_THLAR|nr:unnamed protein product [Thlaspi arvense]
MQLLQQLFPKSQNSSSSSRLVNVAIVSSSLFIAYFFLSLLLLHTTKYVNLSSPAEAPPSPPSPTSVEHLVFGIASNEKSWRTRKDYVGLWWKADQMRGCVFLDQMPSSQNDTASLPPICVSEDTSRFPYTYRGGLRSAIRVARVVSETVALNHSNVRWFVFGDDDTVFFPENLVKTLSKYDHELWHYIGTNSEVFMQNKFFSFEMAFGGAGFAISYPLAKVLAKVFDSCIVRYPHLYGSDARVHTCIAELGIGLTREPGFHQTTIGALTHLMQAARADSHRLLQQTVCYDPWFAWTVSVSWGYAVQVFDKHLSLPDVLRTQRTFKPWKKGNVLAESFNFDMMKEYHLDPCQRPAVFFLDKVETNGDGLTRSSYRSFGRDNCTNINVASPKKLEEVRVWSNKLELDIKQLQAPRRHCCDVLPSSAGEVMEIGIRECQEEELIFMHLSLA